MIRPFETDYAGMWRGHCLTRESAIRAAVRAITERFVNKCTITDTRSSQIVARVRVGETRERVVIELYGGGLPAAPGRKRK